MKKMMVLIFSEAAGTVAAVGAAVFAGAADAVSVAVEAGVAAAVAEGAGVAVLGSGEGDAVGAARVAPGGSVVGVEGSVI